MLLLGVAIDPLFGQASQQHDNEDSRHQQMDGFCFASILGASLLQQ